MFLVLSLQEDIDMNLQSRVALIWADGMTGALPVFESYEKALVYAEGNSEIIKEIQYTQESP